MSVAGPLRTLRPTAELTVPVFAAGWADAEDPDEPEDPEVPEVPDELDELDESEDFSVTKLLLI